MSTPPETRRQVPTEATETTPPLLILQPVDVPGMPPLRMRGKEGEMERIPKPVRKAAAWLGPRLGYGSDAVRSSIISRELYYECLQQGTNDGNTEARDFFYIDCALMPTLQSWFQITALHVWMLMARMRSLPGEKSKPYEQELVNVFFEDCSNRMRYVLRISNARVISTYMKDLHSQFRGMCFAYDEMVAKADDKVLASALWRNLLGGRPDVDFDALASLVEYVRGTMHGLEGISDDAFLVARVKFTSPRRPQR